MTSTQRFMPNSRNLIRDAVLSASSVLPSTALRTLAVERQGNGRVRLVGPYTGHEDTTFDVEISSGGSTLRASTPTLVGVGNGTLSVESVTAPAVAETWTMTLVDLGTDTTHAQIQVESVVLRAKTAGSAGNLVRVNVTPDITESATEYSMLAEWPAGTATLSGPEFDFGGYPLNAKGELDANSPRLRWGTDHTVYRPYRAFVDGEWRYGLTPPPPRAIPAGTLARSVSGGYDIEVTDGTDTEPYADVVTFYDLLEALAVSDLVEVVGVVTADRQPGGMAMRDVPLRTSSWVLRATGVSLDGVAPAADAPTETVIVECIKADTVGAEVWSVTGGVSGVIGTATTGVPFESDVIDFEVPDLSDTVSGTGEWRWSYIPTTRAEGETIPSVGVVDFLLGLDARPGTYTFTLEDRPNVSGCAYSLASIDGRVSASCLGLADAGGDMDSTLKTKLTDLYSWHADFLDKITVFGAESSVSTQKISLANRIVGIFASAIEEIYATSAAVSQWDSELTEMKADMEVFDSSYGSTSGTSLTFPYTGTLSVGKAYTISGATYLLTGAILTSGGEIQSSVSVSAMAAPSLTSTTDGEQTAVVGPFTLTFSRREASLKDSVVGDGEGSSTATTVDIEIGGLVAKYEAAMDHCRVLAGISPKSNASGTYTYGTGDGCWRDSPDATQWWVPDSGHLPAFSNKAWISSRASTDSGASAGIPAGEPYSTREFGLAIAVHCDDRLKSGDKIVVVIGAVDGRRPYAVGSVSRLDVVTAGPAWLAGGVDGDDTHTWRVVGSSSGAHADYSVPSDGSPVPAYTDDGVTMQYTPGGIPAVLGDVWTFDIESGQFRWRKAGGPWSSLTDIDSEVALSDGVSAAFHVGAAPSFVGDDLYAFGVEQPAAPSHLQSPDDSVWRWSGSGGVIVAAMGDVMTVHALTLARYSLPDGATVTIEGGDGSTWTESQSMDVSGSVSAVILDVPWTVSHLRLTVASATGGEIGWWWGGEPLATEHSASTCRLERQWATLRGAGLNPSSQYLGRGMGGEVAWSADASRPLTEADRDALLAMLDDMQQNGEPMVVVPHYMHAEEAALVSVQFDRIDMRDVTEWAANDTSMRQISMSIPLAAVIS